MAYATASNPQNRVTALVVVGGIHAGIAALLVYGLAVGEFEKLPPPPFGGEQIPIEPPPPTPDPTPKPDTKAPESSRQVVVPDPPISIPTNQPLIDTSDIILPPTPPNPRPVPSPQPTLAPPPPPPVPTPSFDPVLARPSNNPGSWVTQSDYRSSWISREYTGTVGFRLSIGAGGKVEGCSVTKSSGVSELDQATCQLVQRRARFNPAKNDQGRAVAGTYNSAVRWQLPD